MATPFAARTRVAALITTVGLTGVLATTAHAAPASIDVVNNSFTPAQVSINTGESVTWNFKEKNHNVKGSGGISGNNSFGTGTYTKTFDAPGSFSFVCEAHPDMKGTVTVAAAAAPQGPAPAAGPGAGASDASNPTAGAAAATTAAWTFPSAEDRLAPALRNLRASVRKSRPTLSVNLSEDALVVVGLRRKLTARKASTGTRTLRLRGKKGANRFNLRVGKLRRGSYKLRVVAVDTAGNESSIRTATLRVR